MMPTEEEKVAELEKRQTSLEVLVATITSDLRYIKDSVDNRLVTNIRQIFLKLDNMSDGLTIIETTVKANSRWIGLLLKAFVWIATTGILGGVVSIIFLVTKHCLSV